VQGWFCGEELDRLMGVAAQETDRLARAWLLQSGKRWRPFLTVSIWKALQKDSEAVPTDDVRRIAIAVECFHKASLVHDDIEDSDDLRYGEPTLHAAEGVPIALNVGDFLLGEGYRLIGECTAEPAKIAAMLRIAAEGHRTLCMGQGAELSWMRRPRRLSTIEVLNIFREKTSPAFEVALQLGAVLGDETTIAPIISRFSRALGIAYQIRDDVDDFEGEDASDLMARRPTLPLAVLQERTDVNVAQVGNVELKQQMEELDVLNRCRILQESYKEEALRALAELKQPNIKGLLRRVVSKIFSLEVKGWCSEFESRNAANSPPGA
jgi:geranylgeranyl pyrophosphate synthase